MKNGTMKNGTLIAGLVAASFGVPTAVVGCQQKAETKAEQKAEQKDDSKPRVLETVEVAPGKTMSPKDEAKVSSLGIRVLAHVSNAQQDLQAKNPEGAKKELAQAATLLNILKEILPTVKVIDHIWVAKTDLSYVNTTEVPQDMVEINASVDQIYDLLPAGKAKEHAQKAKAVLAKDKQKGAAKATEELEIVEDAMEFSEVDLSVSFTSRMVKAAQADLEAGKTAAAVTALTEVADGVVFFDATAIDPAESARRRIWLSAQDYKAKNYKAAKTRLGMAKATLQDLEQSGTKAIQDCAKHLVTEIDAIDASKAGDKTQAAFDALCRDSRQLVDVPESKGKK